MTQRKNETREDFLARRRAAAKIYNAAHRAEIAAWSKANPERMKAYRARRYAKNREKILERKKLRYAEHAAEMRAKAKEYHVKHADKIRAYAKRWYKANRKKNADRVRKWRETNRAAFLVYHCAYNAKYYRAHRDEISAKRRERRQRLKDAGKNRKCKEM